ncbi:MAG TPA: cyclase family protein [Thermoleophilaceae bacterium]|nr:cyclase family protein [Thermoleophilaceae bacterium]
MTAPATTSAIGALDRIDAAKRLEALSLIREGRVYDLSHVLDETVPVFPGRNFHQTLVTTAHHSNGGGVGENQVNWITEVYSSTSQLGTHLDSLAHLQRGMHGYGGISVDELADATGVKQLGAETIPQIVTHGWLVDVAPLGPGEVITPDDVAHLSPSQGDAVLFHTGWGRHWDDPDAYLAGEPGPGLKLADWLARRGVALTGCDTWSYGPVPAEDPARPFEVPQTLNVDHGVFIVENLDLSQLATDGVREFCLVLTHPKLRGATGAWTAPIALV